MDQIPHLIEKKDAPQSSAALALLGGVERPKLTITEAPKGRADEDRLVADMIELARQYGRYGRSIVITSGHMTLFTIGQMTGRHSVP
ncbi:hypothetical protein PJL69_15460 [Shimia sp. MMG029]|nr:hypothetical protein [Shimia sp. MMG029]MDA5558167.1 hypothetical protein [Shimia sp. MMG029]